MDSAVRLLLARLEQAKSDIPYWGTRQLAAVAADREPLDVCAAVIEQAEEDEEFRACLTQELVLRVRDLDRAPFARFWEELRSRDHPLGLLPLRLMPPEGSIDPPSYTFGGGRVSSSSDLWEEGSPEAHPQRVAPVATEATDPALCRRLMSAVASWLEGSNGRTESRVFVLAGAPQPRLADVLGTAGLDCIGRSSPPDVKSVTAEDAFAALFAAAAVGGAYEIGCEGAYGRLRAWETVGALSGAEAGDPVESTSERAQRSAWFTFKPRFRWLRSGSNSTWFEEQSWDLALAVVSPERTRLAVLAATDTD